MSEKSPREYQKVIDYIYDQIAQGALSVGDKLPTERALAMQLTVSRNSTREALRTLENMGVVQSKQGSGNYVSDNLGVSISQMIRIMLLFKQTSRKDVCEFRRAMEKSICTMILANPDAKPYLLEAKDLINRWPDENIEKQSKIDYEFHYCLIRATQNSFWIMFMEALTEVYRQWITASFDALPTDKNKLLQQIHHALIDALIAGDSASCMQAIDDHYNFVNELFY